MTPTSDDLVFEMELMKSIEINIDYILFLAGQPYGNERHDHEIIIKTMKSVEASPDLRNKKELIEDFIESHTPENDVHGQWHEFRDGNIREGGTEIAEIIPPMGLFGNAGVRRAEKKKRVAESLREFFDRFHDISGGVFHT